MRGPAITALLAALALALAGCGGGAEEAGGPDQVTVELAAQNGSGESGQATLTADGDSSTKVVLDLENGTSEPQPAHIHPGSCVDLDPTPKYGLANVVDGNSETTVPTSLADLRKAAYAINVHKSAAEVQTYVSCGDIGGKGGSSGSDGKYGY
jgi:hypothetical protein